jgi:hypothetical protein
VGDHWRSYARNQTHFDGWQAAGNRQKGEQKITAQQIAKNYSATNSKKLQRNK